MEWLLTIGLVIIFIVIGLIFFIFMPKPIVFFEPYTDSIKIFNQYHDEIKKEVSYDTTTSVIPIYGLGEIKSERYPKLYELLQTIPYVRYAGILNIKPKYEQVAEYGYDNVANHTIRHFYTVQQSASLKSGIWIDGERRFFTEKEWILGDMAREHYLYNKNRNKYSTVIFIDIDRHPSIHDGRSPNTKLDSILSVF